MVEQLLGEATGLVTAWENKPMKNECADAFVQQKAEFFFAENGRALVLLGMLMRSQLWKLLPCAVPSGPEHCSGMACRWYSSVAPCDRLSIVVSLCSCSGLKELRAGQWLL